MKPRTLITLAVIAWLACGLGQDLARQARNRDLENVTWAAHECCGHWAWQLGLASLYVWHLLGDRLGGGHKGGGRDN